MGLIYLKTLEVIETFVVAHELKFKFLCIPLLSFN